MKSNPLVPLKSFLQPKTVRNYLGIVSLFLIIANILFFILNHFIEGKYIAGLFQLFSLSAENSAARIFSGGLFFICSILLYIIWKQMKQKNQIHIIWLLIAGLFLFLALEDLLMIYDIIIRPVRKMYDISFKAWVISVGILLIIMAFMFFPVWRNLEDSVKKWLSISAITYLCGSIVFELMGHARLYQTEGSKDIIYDIFDIVEESLEFAGLIIFIYSLLLIIQIEFKGMHIIIPERKDSIQK